MQCSDNKAANTNGGGDDTVVTFRTDAAPTDSSNCYIKRVKQTLQRMLPTDQRVAVLVRPSDPSSSQLQVHLPAAAAEKFRTLASQQHSRLQDLGITSVQVAGQTAVTIAPSPVTQKTTSNDALQMLSRLGFMSERSECAAIDTTSLHSMLNSGSGSFNSLISFSTHANNMHKDQKPRRQRADRKRSDAGQKRKGKSATGGEGASDSPTSPGQTSSGLPAIGHLPIIVQQHQHMPVSSVPGGGSLPPNLAAQQASLGFGASSISAGQSFPLGSPAHNIVPNFLQQHQLHLLQQQFQLRPGGPSQPHTGGSPHSSLPPPSGAPSPGAAVSAATSKQASSNPPPTTLAASRLQRPGERPRSASGHPLAGVNGSPFINGSASEIVTSDARSTSSTIVSGSVTGEVPSPASTASADSPSMPHSNSDVDHNYSTLRHDVMINGATETIGISPVQSKGTSEVLVLHSNTDAVVRQKHNIQNSLQNEDAKRVKLHT